MDKNSVIKKLLISIKAFVVGATMVIPGVSGGSMAMILGEYDKLIGSVPGLLRKNSFKNSFIYLCIFCISAVLGIFLASKPLEMLLNSYYGIVMFFFIGAVIGTVPMIIKKAGSFSSKKIPLSIIYILIGIVVVYLISLIPEGNISPSLDGVLSSYIYQIMAGVLISIGFILPGISTSYLLVVLGLYHPILNAISSLNVLPLIPLAVGMLLGTLILTEFLKWAMEKHPFVTYMTILGFLFGSIIQVFPPIPSGVEVLFSIISLCIGTLAIYWISLKE